MITSLERLRKAQSCCTDRSLRELKVLAPQLRGMRRRIAVPMLQLARQREAGCASRRGELAAHAFATLDARAPVRLAHPQHIAIAPTADLVKSGLVGGKRRLLQHSGRGGSAEHIYEAI